MTSMVIMNSTLEFLILSVNTPLKHIYKGAFILGVKDSGVMSPNTNLVI